MSADSTESHLYAGLAAKMRRFARRFGASELLWKPVRVALSPLVIPFLPERTFEFKDQTLRCFYHRYNITWAAERGVEIPIAQSYLGARPDARVLEVGNVLSHYYPSRHEIVDKFERGPRIINVDIVDYSPPTRYDLILSISTFEHIGFDDEASGSSGEKILAALANCRRLLSERGLLVITVPTGYNPDLDEMIRDGSLGASAEHFLCRTGRRQWRPCSKDEALKCRYRRPYPYANGLLVAEFTRARAG
jgi:SAM-dependent methyltransferase